MCQGQKPVISTFCHPHLWGLLIRVHRVGIVAYTRSKRFRTKSFNKSLGGVGHSCNPGSCEMTRTQLVRLNHPTRNRTIIKLPTQRAEHLSPWGKKFRQISFRNIRKSKIIRREAMSITDVRHTCGKEMHPMVADHHASPQLVSLYWSYRLRTGDRTWGHKSHRLKLTSEGCRIKHIRATIIR